MLVSIIIPAHNAAGTIKRTIASALVQDHQDTELILVDNNSSDGTLKIMEAAALEHPEKIRVSNCPIQGCSAARNWGIKLSKGEWLQFLDADDALEPGKIKNQVAVIKADTGWIISPYRILFPDGNILVNMPTADLWKGLVYQYRTGYTCSNLYRRESLATVGNWNEALPDNTDPYLHFELLKAGVPHLVTLAVETNYYQHNAPGRVSTNSPVAGNQRRIHMLAEVNQFLKHHQPDYWEQNSNYFSAALLSTIRILATHDLSLAFENYRKYFHSTDLTSLFGQPMISKSFLRAYQLLGFRRTEWLRLHGTSWLPTGFKNWLKTT
ncbi:glycosyltransferase family 2 protein [Neolewinella persica]|uniref:glycosyltransferase family 2 protein n=1 Tax=Neolewinella persica TaxID=70998 RepID=UPI000361B2D5|nr:glycosyltransferase family A protein [Neolewinella persica]